MRSVSLLVTTTRGAGTRAHAWHLRHSTISLWRAVTTCSQPKLPGALSPARTVSATSSRAKEDLELCHAVLCLELAIQVPQEVDSCRPSVAKLTERVLAVGRQQEVMTATLCRRMIFQGW